MNASLFAELESIYVHQRLRLKVSIYVATIATTLISRKWSLPGVEMSH